MPESHNKSDNSVLIVIKWKLLRKKTIENQFEESFLMSKFLKLRSSNEQIQIFIWNVICFADVLMG
jgi:hypothetical protein